MADLALITGFPRLLARGLARRGLALHPHNRVVLLVESTHAEAAAEFVAGLDDPRVEVLIGQPSAVDFSASGADVRRLLAETTHFFHADHLESGTRQALRKANVRTLMNVLGLAFEMKALRRLVVFSTAFVSGDRTGEIREEELECGQRFRTAFEQAMYEAERLARLAMPRLPVTVLRPAGVIGHSRTGESSGLTEGPNYLVRLMIRLPAEVPFLLPGTGVVPFNIVPIDYVVQAAWALAKAPEAAGRTFHLTDPNPVSARKAFDLLGDLANRPAPFVGPLPARLIRRGLNMSGLGRLVPNQLALLHNLTEHVTYSCAGALELLADTGIACPPFESYADQLVAWVAAYERQPSS